MQSVVYAELGLDPPQLSFKKSDNDVEYTEALPYSGFIIQADKLKQNLQANLEKIEKLETKIKELFASDVHPNILNATKTELRETNGLKHDLRSQLQGIRKPLNNEFANNYKHAENKVADLEERIKDEHGGKYSQSMSKLILAQQANISLIQKNIAFEQEIANSSKDDLKAKTEAHLHALYTKELGLQNKLLLTLQEKKDIIGHNVSLHSADTEEYASYKDQFDKSVENIVICNNRIFILENEIKTREKAFQSEEVEFITIGALKKNESQYEDNECYNIKEQINKTSIPPTVDPSTKPKYVESIPKSTKEQGAVPKKKPNADKLEINPVAKTERPEQTKDSQKSLSEVSKPTQQPKDFKNLSSFKDKQKLIGQLLAKPRRSPLGISVSQTTLFASSGNSSLRDKKKTQETETKRKEFSR